MQAISAHPGSKDVTSHPQAPQGGHINQGSTLGQRQHARQVMQTMSGGFSVPEATSEAGWPSQSPQSRLVSSSLCRACGGLCPASVWKVCTALAVYMARRRGLLSTLVTCPQAPVMAHGAGWGHAGDADQAWPVIVLTPDGEWPRTEGARGVREDWLLQVLDPTPASAGIGLGQLALSVKHANDCAKCAPSRHGTSPGRSKHAMHLSACPHGVLDSRPSAGPAAVPAPVTPNPNPTPSPSESFPTHPQPMRGQTRISPTFRSMSSSAAFWPWTSPRMVSSSSRVPSSRPWPLLGVSPQRTITMRAATLSEL